MIELSVFAIKNYNAVIEARKKLYRLSIDLGFDQKLSTQLAVSLSELLRELLCLNQCPEVKFAFSKKEGKYSLHVCIYCSNEIYKQLKHTQTYNDILFENKEESESYIVLSALILNPSFVPDDEFLQKERERLIQQSSNEMLYEIRRKNAELSKALDELKTSAQTIQVEKMRALGDMTAGVAHELNNPMMGILNFIQYAIKHTDEEDRKYRPLVDAEREVKRCQDIITNLLTFSRMKAEGEEGFKPGKLSQLCRRIVKLHSYKIRSANVEIEECFPETEPLIDIKANKVQQVVLNFVTNAIDAMQDREQKKLSLAISHDDTNICLRVCDTGSGIDEETQDKIFEPFFTTKPTDKGTGLGLSVSKSIIEEHDGTLTCESELGIGTCFVVTLPLSQNKIGETNE